MEEAVKETVEETVDGGVYETTAWAEPKKKAWD